MASENIGRVIQVIGPVVDIEFPNGVPAIYNAVNIEGGNIRVVVEVEQHLGENRVRCVAMQPTDGMAARHGRQGHSAPRSWCRSAWARSAAC
jgi:F-type H+-transporting ATPase subunit beta